MCMQRSRVLFVAGFLRIEVGAAVSFLIGREPMVSQKTRSGASSLDRQFEWFFKVKGVKKEMRSPLWVAMDTANLLIASDNVRVRALQDVSWKLINMYLANVEMAAGAEEGRFRDVCVQTATALRASSLNNGVVELVVATIMHLREGTFDGLLETLHAAAGCTRARKAGTGPGRGTVRGPRRMEIYRWRGGQSEGS